MLPARYFGFLLSIYRMLRNLKWIPYKRAIEKKLADAKVNPEYLDTSELERLQNKYQFASTYQYTPEALAIRGNERADKISTLQGAEKAERFLELGCWDGMVSCALQQKGKIVTAIDQRDLGFEEIALNAGVELIQMDASNLAFESGSFDFVFSFDAFEHFSNPQEVFEEALRVTKNGGYIYLEFGPLYDAPYGEHAYHSITVPYCQFLWSKSQLTEFCIQHKLKPIDYEQVNGWSLQQYRELWEKYSSRLTAVDYHERKNLAHIDLIRKYPSCFSKRSRKLEDFTVTEICVLFKKVG